MTLHVDIEPLLPVTWGDQPQLQEALATLLGDAIAGSKQRELELHLEKHSAGSQISISTSGAMTPTVHTALATHLVEMMGGRVERSSSALRIEL